MIDEAIEYGVEAMKVVNKFNARKPGAKKADYWYADELEEVKREIKNFYKNKQQFTCSYCLQNFRVKHAATWDTEHVVPRKTHPQFMFEPKNLCIACKDCNGIKGDANVLKHSGRKTYPKRGADFFVVHPHFDEYDDHIVIYSGKIYIPLTDKGKFTIELCGLLRFAYQGMGWDPLLALAPQLMQLATELLEAKGQAEQLNLMQQIVIISQLRVGEYLKKTLMSTASRGPSKGSSKAARKKKSLAARRPRSSGSSKT